MVTQDDKGQDGKCRSSRQQDIKKPSAITLVNMKSHWYGGPESSILCSFKSSCSFFFVVSIRVHCALWATVRSRAHQFFF